MPQRIEAIRLEGFRGATCQVELRFNTQKPVAMIFGENGTGKSTIVDAIDFVCNGQPGSLRGRSSTNVKSYLPSLGTKAEDLKVSLSFGGQTWVATLASSGTAEIAGPEGPPTARILRRSMILGVVTAEPKERYEALKGFIGLPNVQKCEDSLREAVRAAEYGRDETKRAARQAEESLHTLWKAEGSPGEGAWSWAKSEAAKDATALDTEVKVASSFLECLSACVAARDDLQPAASQHERGAQALRKTKEDLEQARKVVRLDAVGLVQVLQDAESYLTENPQATECPVCEQKVDPSTLRVRIQRRLDQMKRVVECRNLADSAEEVSKQQLAVLLSSKGRFARAAIALRDIATGSNLPEVASLKDRLVEFAQLRATTGLPPEPAAMEQARNAVLLLEPCEPAIRTRRDLAQKSLNQLNAIKGHVNAVEGKTAAAKRRGTVAGRLRAFLEVVEQARKAYVENILTAISGIVEELYLKVHPDEGIGGIRLYLDPRFQGSLQFHGNFQSETGVPPQAYYSESHLDTLGVCIFLALARHFHDGNTVVVLDDVLTSVDSVHVGRFMDMLHGEATRYNQLIMTTHYRPWQERYRFAHGPTANVQLIELLHWSLPRGIRHTRTKLSVEELQEALAAEPLDRQAVSSKAGILMESLLDHVALLYGCRLPRKAEPEYTLGELTDCVGSRLRKALKVQRMLTKAKPDEEPKVGSETPIDGLLTRIAGINWIRNRVGCHHSSWGPEVSDGEVKEFASRTIEFAEVLVCDHCGEVPRVEKAGAYHQCGCGKTRLHPCNNPD